MGEQRHSSGGWKPHRAVLWGIMVAVMVVFGVAGWWVVGLFEGKPAAVETGVTTQEAKAPEEMKLRPEVPVFIPPPMEVQGSESAFPRQNNPPTPWALSPDGKMFLASKSEINKPRGRGTIDSLLLCDVMNGEIVKTIMGPSDKDEYQIRTACFSADGKLAVTGNFYGWVRLWNVETGQEMGTWKEERIIEAVAFSPEGKRFATAGYGGQGGPTIEVYEVGKTEKLFSLAGHTRAGVTGIISQVLFTPDGKRLVSGADDRTIRVWDLEQKKEAMKLEGHTQAISTLALSPDGKLLASGGRDGRVCLWEMADGKLVRRTREPADQNGNSAIGKVLFTPDGKRLVIGYQNGTHVMDVETGQVMVAYRTHGSGILLMPDGETFLLNNAVWRIPPGLQAVAGAFVPADADPPRFALKALGPPALTEVAGANAFFTNQVRAMALIKGEKEVLGAYGGWNKPAFVRWDMSSGANLGRIECGMPIFGQGGIEAFSPDGVLAALSSAGGKLILAETATGKEVRTCEVGSLSVSKAVFSPDGAYLVAAQSPRLGDGNKADIFMFRAADGQLVKKLEGSTDWVLALAMTGDGKRIISGEGAREIDPNSPAGQWPQAMLRCYVRVWDTESGKELRRMEGHTGPVDALAVTADGRRAISGAERGESIVWDLESGKELMRLAAHLNRNGHVETRAVAISADGRHGATGGADCDIRYYDLESGKELCRFEQHTGAVTSLRFMADGKRLLSAGEDGTIRMWVLP